jgi:hypothetical protein
MVLMFGLSKAPVSVLLTKAEEMSVAGKADEDFTFRG